MIQGPGIIISKLLTTDGARAPQHTDLYTCTLKSTSMHENKILKIAVTEERM